MAIMKSKNIFPAVIGIDIENLKIIIDIKKITLLNNFSSNINWDVKYSFNSIICRTRIAVCRIL
jgi:hypothetical protein